MRVPEVLKNVALSAVVTAVLLAGLEGTGRILDPQPQAPPRAEYLWDWEEHWEGEFYTLATASAGWPPGDEINGDGVRDRPHPLEGSAGVMRLVFLGDSVTFGAGVEAQHAYPQLLQRRFDAEGRPLEVFNVGLWGWSTRQQRLAWQRIARRYAPDLVVVAVCLNDIPEMHNNLSRPPAWIGWLHERSAFVRWVVDAPAREIRSVEQLFREPDAARVRAGWSLFFEELRELRGEVTASGAELGLMVFPFRFQVEAGAPEPLPQREIARFASEQGIAFLDLLPALEPLGEAGFVDYDHLSPEGAERAAAAIASSALLAGAPAAAAGRLEAAGLRGDVAGLAQALLKGDEPLRSAAAWGLGQTGSRDASAGEALAAALRGDASELVRARSARALGAQASPAGVVPLLSALADPRQSVRWAAADALHALPLEAGAVPALAAALESDDAYLRAFAGWTLGGMGEAATGAVPSLAAALRRDGGAGRAGAAAALTRLGAVAVAAVPVLVEELSHARSDRRWRAARALGRIGPGAGEAAPALARALEDAEPRVRVQAARALGRLGAAARPELPALVRALQDPQESVRREALQAMGEIPGR